MGVNSSHDFLADISDVRSGKRLPKGEALVGNATDYPYIRLVDIAEGRIHPRNMQFLTLESRKKIKRYIVNNGDVCLAIVGHTIGMVFYVSREWDDVNLTENAARITNVSSDYHSKFIYYYLISPIGQNEISVRTVGSAQGKLPLYNIKSIRIPRLPRTYQDAVVTILGSLDDKIELNRQMNQTLEAMAQALFKSWFVDFDPVIDNALAAGKPIPEALQVRAQTRRQVRENAASALPVAVRELFPSEFEFTEEMGWVPEGWAMIALDDLAHYQNGLALQKYRPEDGELGLPVLKIAQLRKGFADGEERASNNISPACIVDDGDIVFSWSGSLMVEVWCGGKVALNQHLFKVTSDVSPKWLYYAYTQHHLEEFQRIASDKAVTMGHIKRKHLSEAKCAVPSTDVLEKVRSYFEPNLHRRISCHVQNRYLSKLRDTLLPKLISGELRIPNAEKLVAEAGL